MSRETYESLSIHAHKSVSVGRSTLVSDGAWIAYAILYTLGVCIYFTVSVVGYCTGSPYSLLLAASTGGSLSYLLRTHRYGTTVRGD